MSLDPIAGCGEAEDACEAGGGFLVAGGHRSPFLQPRPEALDAVAVGVDPVRAALGASLLLDGIAGVAPTSRNCCRKRWLE